MKREFSFQFETPKSFVMIVRLLLWVFAFYIAYLTNGYVTDMTGDWRLAFIACYIFLCFQGLVNDVSKLAKREEGAAPTGEIKT